MAVETLDTSSLSLVNIGFPGFAALISIRAI